jgi:hypothetical protein
MSTRMKDCVLCSKQVTKSKSVELDELLHGALSVEDGIKQVFSFLEVKIEIFNLLKI